MTIKKGRESKTGGGEGRLSTHLSCSQEHKCVLDSCRAVENEGFEVTYLPVQKNGIVNLNVSL